ncbi:hypothetical protein, partial [Klebsiella pneumoniae]|uniref:hypothetical protein n=1 Tax=Klebsiella pneumoniae TaxID=573 RepID=UPI0024DEB667
ARFTTSRFEGVLRDLVDVKMKMTIPLPTIEITPRTPITKPRIPCQRGFIGGNWYQCGSTRWSISGGTLSTTVLFPRGLR